MEENPLSAFFRNLERVVVRASETARELKDSDAADEPPSRNAARILALRNISSESSQMRETLQRALDEGNETERALEESIGILEESCLERQDAVESLARKLAQYGFKDKTIAMETSESSTPFAAAAALASVEEATRQSLTPQLQGISKATRRQLKEQAEMRGGTAIVATPRRDGHFPLHLETPKSTALGIKSVKVMTANRTTNAASDFSPESPANDSPSSSSPVPPVATTLMKRKPDPHSPRRRLPSPDHYLSLSPPTPHPPQMTTTTAVQRKQPEPEPVSTSLASLAALAAQIKSSATKQQLRRKLSVTSSPLMQLGGKQTEGGGGGEGEQFYSPQPATDSSPRLDVDVAYFERLEQAKLVDNPSELQRKLDFSQMSFVTGEPDVVSAATANDVFVDEASRNDVEESRLSTRVIPQVDVGDYDGVPDYLKGQISLTYLNGIINDINAFTEKKATDRGTISTSEMREDLGLGSRATTVQLFLMKLNRLKKCANATSGTGSVRYSIC